MRSTACRARDLTATMTMHGLPHELSHHAAFLAACTGFALFYSVAVIFFYYEWIFTSGSDASTLAYGVSLNLSLVAGAALACACSQRLASTRPLFFAGHAAYAGALGLLLASRGGTLAWAVYLAGACAGAGAALVCALWFERLGSLSEPPDSGTYVLGVGSFASVPLSVIVGLLPIGTMVPLCAIMLLGSALILLALGTTRPLPAVTRGTEGDDAHAGIRAHLAPLVTPLAYVALLSFLYGTVDDVAMTSNLQGANNSGVLSQACSVLTALAFLAYVRSGGRRYTAVLNVSVGMVTAGLALLPFMGYEYSLLLTVVTHMGWEMSLLVFYALALDAGRGDRCLSLAVSSAAFALPRPFVVAGTSLVAFVAPDGSLELAHTTAIAFVALYAVLATLSLAVGREKRSARREAARRDELVQRYVAARNDLYALACADLAARFGLTPRETDVARLLAQGRDLTYVENALGISRNTVKGYTKTLYTKLGIHSKQELIDLVEQGAGIPS